MKIKTNDLVLEVGSGDKPYARSDILLDKALKDSSEREAGKKLVIDRPLVIAGVETMPFADKSFDYIIASHVLEHANNPAKFLDELARVGKRGFIETPLPLRERVFNWPFHHWYVMLKGKQLVLIRKTAKSKKLYSGLTENLRQSLGSCDGRGLFNLQFEWQNKIKYQIYQSEPCGFLNNLDRELMILRRQTIKPQTSFFKNELWQLKSGLQNKYIRWTRKKKINLLSLVVCPHCKAKLKQEERNLVCINCDRVYTYWQNKTPQLI